MPWPEQALAHSALTLVAISVVMATKKQAFIVERGAGFKEEAKRGAGEQCFKEEAINERTTNVT